MLPYTPANTHTNIRLSTIIVEGAGEGEGRGGRGETYASIIPGNRHRRRRARDVDDARCCLRSPSLCACPEKWREGADDEEGHDAVDVEEVFPVLDGLGLHVVCERHGGFACVETVWVGL